MMDRGADVPVLFVTNDYWQQTFCEIGYVLSYNSLEMMIILG